jgi:hypothetical protein
MEYAGPHTESGACGEAARLAVGLDDEEMQ